MSKDLAPTNVPVLTPEGSFASYLSKIRKFPMLDAAEEYVLAKNWRDKGDKEAAHKLVTSHLRLVAKIAMGYRGYGLPVSELVSEGNIGLMQAVKKFDPEKGFRLTTYAIWWIKASIQEYVLRSWSLVKIGTTSAQKKLFFNLKKIKNQIFAAEQGDLLPEHVTEIANQLNVREDEVVSMNQRLAGHEHSLNAHVGNEEGDAEWQDWVVDEEADQELQISQRQELNQRQALLKNALHVLDEREKEILYDRRLIDEPKTLEELSQKYKVSRERIRQIENRAFEKVQKAMLENIKQPKQLSVN
ncbi:MAG: RNA polymerase sigma factor RpoH [Proteobacteria bacterium]|jgi:RNA polymerase sigma-32 factor|nr:RNA polymerase sigma factor RpoH [Pseudomonadota bacterium]MDA0972030.1 RNA polymerase sigma factor RpoH [Pseudomonadota bacterium]